MEGPNNVDAIQIMQLWRMMDLSICTQGSTFVQSANVKKFIRFNC